MVAPKIRVVSKMVCLDSHLNLLLQDGDRLVAASEEDIRCSWGVPAEFSPTPEASRLADLPAAGIAGLYQHSPVPGIHSPGLIPDDRFAGVEGKQFRKLRGVTAAEWLQLTDGMPVVQSVTPGWFLQDRQGNVLCPVPFGYVWEGNEVDDLVGRLEAAGEVFLGRLFPGWAGVTAPYSRFVVDIPVPATLGFGEALNRYTRVWREAGEFSSPSNISEFVAEMAEELTPAGV
jgi:hypothetical protein